MLYVTVVLLSRYKANWSLTVLSVHFCSPLFKSCWEIRWLFLFTLGTMRQMVRLQLVGTEGLSNAHRGGGIEPASLSEWFTGFDLNCLTPKARKALAFAFFVSRYPPLFEILCAQTDLEERRNWDCDVWKDREWLGSLCWLGLEWVECQITQ